MGKARRFRKSRRLDRKAHFVDPAPVLLAVCEGKTEERLLDGLRREWRIPSARVVLVPRAGVPSTIVKKAKALRAELQAHEAWVVFDRDEHPNWTGAIHEAEQARPPLVLAISNPCFELWALLLHGDQRAALHRHEAQRRLARVHPGYDHHKNPYLTISVVLPLLADAARRARQLNADAESLGEPHRSPTTRFSDLVDRLRSIG